MPQLATITEIKLETNDIQKLQQRFGSNLVESLIKTLWLPIISTSIILSIVALITILNLIIGVSISIQDLFSFSFIVSGMCFIVVWVFTLSARLPEYWHCQKIIQESKKFRLIGPVAKVETAVSSGEYGQSEPLMVFRTRDKSVNFALSDLNRDYAEKGGWFEIDFVQGLKYRIDLKISRKE